MSYLQARNVVGVGIVAVVLGLSAGCASTAQIDEIKAMAQEAKTMAADAQATATQAASDAAAAKAGADQANACCRDTNEKLDRMFKKSMHK